MQDLKNGTLVARILTLLDPIIDEDLTILPPVKLLARCHALIEGDARWTHDILGYSEKGHPIHVFSFGEGPHTTLWYGFPDPGEALGGTTILTLMKALSCGALEVSATRWSFIPVIDFDLQPHDGHELVHVMSEPGARLVDMCCHAPRPETIALLDHVAQTSPSLVYSLHDEYHCGEHLPAYAVVHDTFPRPLVDHLKEIWETFDYPANQEMQHPIFGAGFLKPNEDAAFYATTTFQRYEAHGQMLIFELSEQPHLTPRDLVTMQLAAGLVTWLGLSQGDVRLE